MKPVEIEFLMKDNLTGGLDKAGAREAGVGADDVGAELRLADSLPRVGLADENFI